MHGADEFEQMHWRPMGLTLVLVRPVTHGSTKSTLHHLIMKEVSGAPMGLDTCMWMLSEPWVVALSFGFALNNVVKEKSVYDHMRYAV